MKRIDIDDATSPLRKYAGAIRQGPLVLTRRGKPIAALVSLKGFDVESLTLSNNPAFISMIERSRESIRRGQGITSDEMRLRLGLPSKKSKRS